jgi:hypothetical protein
MRLLYAFTSDARREVDGLEITEPFTMKGLQNYANISVFQSLKHIFYTLKLKFWSSITKIKLKLDKLPNGTKIFTIQI